MRVPDLSTSQNARETSDKANADEEIPVTPEPNDTLEMKKRERRCKKCFRGPFKVVSAPDPPARSTRAKAHAQALGERQRSCPQGKAFYKCANGFTGCCSVDPCNSGGTCSDDQGTSSTHTAQATSSNAPRSSPSGIPTLKAGAARRKPTSTPNSSSGMQTSSPTGLTPSSRSESNSEPVKSAPACPGANNTIFHDASHIMYRIHCGIDNTYSSNKEVSVGSGGYGECFSSCSTSSSCAGFTFVGDGSGHCYLRSQMPKALYVDRDNGDYISCSKIHPTVSAAEPGNSTTPATSKKSSLGAIIGGALAGAFLLILLILLIAYLIKRHKKKAEQRRSTIITHLTHGPIEPQQPLVEVGGYHQRQVSTSHDVFQQQQQQPSFQGRPQQNAAVGGGNNDSTQTTGQASRSTIPPGIRAEGGPFVVPAGSYKRPYEEEIPMLYRASVDRSRASGARSPRFQEHFSRLDDAGFPSPWSKRNFASSPLADSPTLGRRKEPPPPLSLDTRVRHERRVFLRNPYEPYGADNRDGGASISPNASSGPSDGKFDVSPLDSFTGGGGRWR